MNDSSIRKAIALAVLVLSVSIAHGQKPDGFFLAIGGIDGKADDGHKLEGQFGTIYHSADGEVWTQVFKGGPVKDDFNHAKNNLLRCATYGNGMFVVTGNPKAVIVSDNGKSWRSVEAPSGAFSVEFGNGIFVAPGAYGFMVSQDALSWQMHRPKVEFPIWGADGAGHVRKIVFGNGVFVCVGDQRLGVTADGKTWKHHQILPPEMRPGRNVLLFGNGRFVWLCEKTGAKSSVDGISWKPITTFADLPATPRFGYSGVFDGKNFLASASTHNDENKIVYSSTDGVNWEKATENAGNTDFNTAGNGVLLRSLGWSKSFGLSADQGKTWKTIKADVPSRQVYYFDGKQIRGQSGG